MKNKILGLTLFLMALVAGYEAIRYLSEDQFVGEFVAALLGIISIASVIGGLVIYFHKSKIQSPNSDKKIWTVLGLIAMVIIAAVFVTYLFAKGI